MKKTTACLLLAFILCSLLPFGEARAAETRPAGEGVFVFPSSLMEIKEDAFADTAVRLVFFGDKLLSIGEGVFSGAAFLTDVYIPPSTIFIGERAFLANGALRIHGAQNSYAQTWAQDHHIPFVMTNIWGVISSVELRVNDERTSLRHTQQNKTEKEYRLHPRMADEGKSMRPQERPELNPIDYKFP